MRPHHLRRNQDEEHQDEEQVEEIVELVRFFVSVHFGGDDDTDLLSGRGGRCIDEGGGSRRRRHHPAGADVKNKPYFQSCLLTISDTRSMIFVRLYTYFQTKLHAFDEINHVGTFLGR